jgi:hypothetical protein
VHRFRPTDFVPRPGVAVVLLRLRRREAPLVAPGDAALFGDFAAYVFTAWQPTVREALARILPRRLVADVERAAGVSLACPPSDIPLTAWITLADTFRTVAGERVTAVEGARELLKRQQLQLRKIHRTRTPRSPRTTGKPRARVGGEGR